MAEGGQLQYKTHEQLIRSMNELKSFWSSLYICI